jgi:hypothetical protein
MTPRDQSFKHYKSGVIVPAEGKSNVKICKGLSIVVLVSWLLWRERIDRSRLQQQKSSACFPIGPACI